MNQELKDIRNRLREIADAESTKLYRQAWRMEKHGCRPENIRRCRNEANELHMLAQPEMLLDCFKVWEYAFK